MATKRARATTKAATTKAATTKAATTRAGPAATPVTIRDIAAKLGISHATVSRALGSHPHINADTRARVKALAERMGYVPNASARAMRSARSALVGLIIPDVQNDFYATVAKIVADALAAQCLQLVLSVTEDDPERELRDLRALLEARAAGVILTPSAAPRAETLALIGNVDAVQVVRSHDDIHASAVVIDDRAGTFAATRHLLAYGHRRIAYIGGTAELSTGRDRLGGFEDALRKEGLKPAHISLGAPRPEFARHAIATMMAAKQRPTGLVLGSSELTLGALQGLRAAQLDWPRDVSVVGYGDPAWFELAAGGITTVSLPVRDVAMTAASLLLARIAARGDGLGDETAAVSRFTPTLVLRGSTAPA